MGTSHLGMSGRLSQTLVCRMRSSAADHLLQALTMQPVQLLLQHSSMSLCTAGAHFSLGCTHSKSTSIAVRVCRLGAVAAGAGLLQKAVASAQLCNLPGRQDKTSAHHLNRNMLGNGSQIQAYRCSPSTKSGCLTGCAAAGASASTAPAARPMLLEETTLRSRESKAGSHAVNP